MQTTLRWLRYKLFKFSGISHLVKSCAVYFLDENIYVVAEVLTDHGRVTQEPMVNLLKDTTAREMGQVVLDALEAFSEIDGPPRPTIWLVFLASSAPSRGSNSLRGHWR